MPPYKKALDKSKVFIYDDHLEILLVDNSIEPIPDDEPLVNEEVQNFIDLFMRESGLEPGERHVEGTNDGPVILRQHFSPPIEFGEAEDLMEKFGLGV